MNIVSNRNGKPKKLSEEKFGLIIETIYRFDYENWKALAGPVVYIRRDVHGKAIYVGSSLEGLGRPFAREHEKAQLESEGETLEVYCLRDWSGVVDDWTPRAQIEAMETYFVNQEEPELNGKPWVRLNARKAKQRVEKEASEARERGTPGA